jgi:site-specific recombinase XerD
MRLPAFVGIIPYGHTFATMLIDDKVDPKTVAELLGHANVVTTLGFYRTVTSEARKAAVSTLAGKFSTDA